jgi:hypothetical protein
LGAAVTARRIRDLHRLLEAEAEPYGAVVRVERTSGSHLKAVFNVGGRETFVITSFSPHSTWRADRKVRAQPRRSLRNLTT